MHTSKSILQIRALAACLSALAAVAFSTPLYAAGSGVGLMGGITLNSPRVETSGSDIDPETQTGYVIALTNESAFNSWLGIETDLIWEHQRFSLIEGDGAQSYTGNMLQIPIMLRLQPVSILSLGAGAYTGITVGRTPGASADLN